LIPAGNLRTAETEFAVKVPGVVENPQDILALPIKRNGDRLITIGDIGDVRRTFKEPRRITRFNGQPTFSIDVVKRSGANILDSVKQVRAAVAEEQKRWPDTIQVAYTFDESEFIERSLTILESGLIIATILVMTIIVGSLGVRQGVMVGVSIPVCFMIGFLLLQAFGLTLNQMVMFGLVLAVGILVDGGIVVVEYADRKMAEGMDREEAFAAAGTRMFWPVVNGTLTTLCAFVPFLFWNSIPGKFMSFLPITLMMVLGASIFVALIFTPAFGSIFGRKQGIDTEHLEEIQKSEHGDPREMKGFMGWYARTLWSAGHHPFRVTAIALLVMVAIVIAFGSKTHRTEFFLDEDPESATVWVKARGNLTAESSDRLVRQVEQRLIGLQGMESLYVASGKFSGGGRSSPPADAVGRIQVEFQVVELEVLYTAWRQGAAGEISRAGNITANNVAYLTSDPLYAFIRFFHSGQIAPVGVNYGHYRDAEMDRLLDSATSSFDVAEQDAIMRRVHEKAVNEALWVFVVHDTNPKALGRNVRGYVPAQHWFQDLTTLA
jgi:multidrug efflux pump